GTDPKIANVVPSDIEIRGNHFFKPLVWQTNGLWVIKNLLELKNAQRVLVSGNILENNWVSGQDGTAIVFTPRNQNGTAPWSVVQDVTFESNVVQHVGGGFRISGQDNNHPSQEAKRILITNNVVRDVTKACYRNTRFMLITTPPGCLPVTDLTVTHNL